MHKVYFLQPLHFQDQIMMPWWSCKNPLPFIVNGHGLTQNPNKVITLSWKCYGSDKINLHIVTTLSSKCYDWKLTDTSWKIIHSKSWQSHNFVMKMLWQWKHKFTHWSKCYDWKLTETTNTSRKTIHSKSWQS